MIFLALSTTVEQQNGRWRAWYATYTFSKFIIEIHFIVHLYSLYKLFLNMRQVCGPAILGEKMVEENEKIKNIF